jgi:hypothetical protein
MTSQSDETACGPALQQPAADLRLALDTYVSSQRLVRIVTTDPERPANVLVPNSGPLALPAARYLCERWGRQLPNRADASLLIAMHAARAGYWVEGAEVDPTDCYLGRRFAILRGDEISIECTQPDATQLPPIKEVLCVVPTGAAPTLPPI